MRNDLIFREAVAGDLHGAVALGLQSYGVHRQVLGEEHWLKMQAGISDIEKWQHLFKISKGFVCCHDNRLAGMAFIIPRGNAWDVFEDGWSYIRMVGVDPEYTGNGIARKLTQMCIMWARENNESIIALHTSEFMDSARHLYEDLGFIRTKEIGKRFGKLYWLYKLELQIAN